MDETVRQIRRELRQQWHGHRLAAEAHGLEAGKALARCDYSAAAAACHRAELQQMCANAMDRWVQ